MRTVAVRPQYGEDWENLVTSMIVSEKTVDEIKIEHEKLPKLNNNQVALFLSVIPFDYSVFEGFARGDIGEKWLSVSEGGFGYGSRHIRTRQFNPLGLKVVSTQRRMEGALKYVLCATDSGSDQERERLWTVIQNQDNEAKRLNYSSILELIKDVLRIETNYRDHKDFECIITDLSQIKDIAFNNTSFMVEITKISGLRDLQLNLVLKRCKKGGFFDPFWREAVTISESEPPPVGKTYVVKKSLKPPSLLPSDLIELKLIHRPSALTLDERYERVPLQNVVEPFFKMLDAFCPINEFRKMLLEPENYGKAPEKIFENAVAWLLSLAGYHTIYLAPKIKIPKGETSFEVLRAKESRYEIGGADIIAYEDNERLLLVDCDIGPFDEKKIQKLIETQRYFEHINKCEKLAIVPVLFSPRAHGEVTEEAHVVIVDKSDIESILEELAKGDRESARSKIRW